MPAPVFPDGDNDWYGANWSVAATSAGIVLLIVSTEDKEHTIGFGAEEAVAVSKALLRMVEKILPSSETQH